MAFRSPSSSRRMSSATSSTSFATRGLSPSDFSDTVVSGRRRPVVSPVADFHDRVGWVHRGFWIDERRVELTGLRQPADELPHNARLVHAAPRRQQRVGSLPNALLGRIKCDRSVGKPVSASSVAPVLSE